MNQIVADDFDDSKYVRDDYIKVWGIAGTPEVVNRQ